MHECPDCSSACYCGGDIDDMLMNDTIDEARCSHWRRCNPQFDDDDVYAEEMEPAR